ncbi:hypothetical protein BC829DRAFT_393799 [Chytridium lagenaria]|nr:hypothetical protein BC829DRAFT_393799 [Chytridium lagenaria]
MRVHLDKEKRYVAGSEVQPLRRRLAIKDNDFALTITRREFNALRYELFALKEIVKGLCQITDLTNLATNFPTWLLELEKKEDIVSQVTRMQETLKRWTVPVEALLQQQLDALKQQQPQQQPLLPQQLQQQPQPQHRKNHGRSFMNRRLPAPLAPFPQFQQSVHALKQEAFEPLSKRTRISVSERPATRQRSVSRRRTDIGKITVSLSRERSEADSGGLKSFSRSRSQWDKTMPSPDKDSGQLSPSRGRIHPDRAFIVDDSRGRSRFNRSVSRGRRTSTHTERNTSIPRGTAPVFAADATSARAGELRPPHKVCYECKVRSSPRWIDGIKDGVAVLFCIRCHRKMGRGSRGISMSRVEYDHDQGARGRSKSRTRL